MKMSIYLIITRPLAMNINKVDNQVEEDNLDQEGVEVDNQHLMVEVDTWVVVAVMVALDGDNARVESWVMAFLDDLQENKLHDEINIGYQG